MSSAVDVPKTFGALLVGAFFASIFYGAVAVQTLLYYKLYPSDFTLLKVLVFVIWLLDTCHTGFIWGCLWEYFINNYGQPELIDSIPWTLAMSIVSTAILTFCVHCFFARRIHKLSKGNWLLTVPIVLLAILRLVSASGTTAEMLRLGSFQTFREQYRWLFTLGLALSCTVDVIITISLFLLLKSSQTEIGNLKVVIDRLVLYSFETGSLTSAATIVSMLCWLIKPTDLVFMGLHFVIGKLYANSFLVTLNTRKNLRERSNHTDGHFPAVMLSSASRQTGPGCFTENESPSSKVFSRGKVDSEIQINVERSVEYSTEYLYGSRPHSSRLSRGI